MSTFAWLEEVAIRDQSEAEERLNEQGGSGPTVAKRNELMYAFQEAKLRIVQRAFSDLKVAAKSALEHYNTHIIVKLLHLSVITHSELQWVIKSPSGRSVEFYCSQLEWNITRQSGMQDTSRLQAHFQGDKVLFHVGSTLKSPIEILDEELRWLLFGSNRS